MKTRLRSILERLLTYALIVGAIAGLLYFLGSVNKNQKQMIEKKRKELSSIQAQQAKADQDLRTRKKRVEAMRAQLQEKRREVKEKFESLLEKKSNCIVFIEQVSDKAKELKVAVNNATYGEPAPVANASGKYLEFKFNMQISAKYDKVKQFLWEIENTLGRLVKISSIEIIPPISTEDGSMSMKLTLSTYFLQ